MTLFTILSGSVTVAAYVACASAKAVRETRSQDMDQGLKVWQTGEEPRLAGESP
jgi:hypothetical protein